MTDIQPNTNNKEIQEINVDENKMRGRIAAMAGTLQSKSEDIISAQESTGILNGQLGGTLIAAGSGYWAWKRWSAAREACATARAQLTDDVINHADDLAKTGKFDARVLEELKTRHQAYKTAEANLNSAGSRTQRRAARQALSKARGELNKYLEKSVVPEVEKAVNGLDDITKTFMRTMEQAGDDIAKRVAAVKSYATAKGGLKTTLAHCDEVAKSLE